MGVLMDVFMDVFMSWGLAPQRGRYVCGDGNPFAIAPH